MRIIWFILTLCLISISTFSQKIDSYIRLNTIVGDTIELEEKRKYNLFESIDTDKYLFSYIFIDNQGKYFQYIKYSTNLDTVVNFSNEEVRAEVKKIGQEPISKPEEQKILIPTKKILVVVSEDDSRHYFKVGNKIGIQFYPEERSEVQKKLRMESSAYRFYMVRINQIIDDNVPLIYVDFKDENVINEIVKLSEIRKIRTNTGFIEVKKSFVKTEYELDEMKDVQIDTTKMEKLIDQTSPYRVNKGSYITLKVIDLPKEISTDSIFKICKMNRMDSLLYYFDSFKNYNEYFNYIDSIVKNDSLLKKNYRFYFNCEKYGNGTIKSTGLEVKKINSPNPDLFFKAGCWRYYYENGEIKKEVNYSINQEKHGVFKEYLKNNRLIRYGVFNHGEKVIFQELPDNYE